jgi:Cu(I)/Ag(I) efflux system membrane protein CusA/SilA
MLRSSGSPSKPALLWWFIFMKGWTNALFRLALTQEGIHEAAIEGAVQRLRPKLMTVCAVLASLVPIHWASGIGSDVMKPIVVPIVGGMITSTIHVLILVPVFLVMIKERALTPNALHKRMEPTTV